MILCYTFVVPIFNLFGEKSKLGIDIGTSSIKVVQLKKEAESYALETYGMVKVNYDVSGKADFDVIAETASVLKKLMTESRVNTKKVVASLPNSIVFVSVITMPTMGEKELKNAIQWEAQRYIPLPLEEVTLSWSVLNEPPENGQMKVLLTAVPSAVIENYLKMFKLAGLEPSALEIEALALIRALVGSRKESLIIVDLGARNTSLNLVDNSFLRVSRNLGVGGDSITNAISRSLKVSTSRAEQFKRDLSFSDGVKEMPQAIREVVDNIKYETLQLVKIFESSGGHIQEIILAGAGAQLPGLSSFFADSGIKITLGDPLKFISYDPRLKANLSEAGLSLSVALGLAMRE